MAESMNKLSQKVTAHTVFEENQVLTSQQLNQLTDYLDQQQRLTRARLLGIGIVCGLDLRMTASSVKLGKGVALTSDGDLLDIEQSRSFGQFKKFTDEDARYPLFRPDGNPLPLFELVAKGGELLSRFSTETGNDLKDMVAVLYLESYRYDPDICTGSGCDNKGQEARNNLKVLLVEAEHAELLSGEQALVGPRYALFAPVAMPRVILTADEINDFPELGKKFREVIDVVLPALLEQFQNAWHPWLRPLLRERYGKADPTLVWGQKLQALLAGVKSSLFGVQYLYDFTHDLQQAYEEFRDALFADNVLCVPPVELFPKHVLLGDLPSAAEFRHGFYASPLLNLKAPEIEKISFLHQRIDRMIRLFSLPSKALDIRITPSRSGCAELGERAVPYYYKPENKQQLTDNWNFELSRRGLQRSLYTYHAQELGGSNEAQTPLGYDLCPYDFFRIEGHLNGHVETVEKELNKQIKDANLPIKLLTLQIETGLPPYFIRPIGPLRDLKVMHRLYRQDLLETFSNVSIFTDKIKTVVKDSDLPAEDAQDETISYQSFIDSSATALGTSISKLSSGLKASHKQFKLSEFKLDYDSALQAAAGINKKIRGVTYASSFTPYETLFNDSKFKYLGWIEGVLAQRLKRAEELSIFAQFLKQAPAMEHLAGVPKGGTFILVYSGSSKRIVADFCLPYWHVDQPDVEEPEDQVVEENEIDWTYWNDDFLVRRPDNVELKESLADLQRKVDAFDWRLLTQEKIAGSMLVAQIEPPADVGMTYGSDDLGVSAELLAGIAKFMAVVDAKVAAGTATDADVARKKEAEAMSGSIIEEKIVSMQEGSKDVRPGSAEEVFIKEAIAVSEKMSASEQQKLSATLVEVQGTTSKTHLKALVSDMIRG